MFLGRGVRTIAKHILVVDDEPQIREVVSEYLKREGFETTLCGTVGEATREMQAAPVDFIVLDLTLPDGSGLDVLRSAQSRHIPTIVLTARVDETDRVVGLELGADDYICKPFSPREVVARVKTVLRRTEGSNGQAHDVQGDFLRIGDLNINIDEHEVYRDGEPAHLTPSEFKLLLVLAKHPGHVFSRSQLLDRLRDDGSIFERTLDRHVNNLRKKIEPNPQEPEYVQTVYGVGYRMRKP